jgi:hypothetical protein
MTGHTSASKRQRAASLSCPNTPSLATGLLQILWQSPFDRLCYQVSSPALATSDPTQYSGLLNHLTQGTGCTEEELLAHGSKVRGILFFAEDHLARRGSLASLVGAQQHRYHLHAVAPEF